MSRPVISIAFPDPWQTIDVESETYASLLDDPSATALFGAEQLRQLREFFDRSRPLLHRAGIYGISTLVVDDELDVTPQDENEAARLVADALSDVTPSPAAMAFAAVGVRAAPRGLEPREALISVAEQDSAVIVERNTTIVERPDGPMARSQTIRRADEQGDGQVSPLVWRVRYALAAGPGTIVYLHCETTTIVYALELETMFDAIAASLLVAPSVRAAP